MKLRSALLYSTMLLVALAVCGYSAASDTDPLWDSDGVQMLFPSAPGFSFQLSEKNPNVTDLLLIEKKTPATPGTDGAVHFWNLPSYALNYASGGKGWTSRLHIYSGKEEQKYTWKTQSGYLASPADLKNQEFTVFVRVHEILSAERAQISLKIRGGAHSSNNDPESASCTMITYSPRSHGSITRFAKELTHPEYDYVVLTPAFSAALKENTWVGLKLVSWNDPNDAAQVIYRLYVDVDPFESDTGNPKNNWRLFSEYVDKEGKSTGQYSKLVDWGGCQTTVRVDGFKDIDFALLSLREILPPSRPDRE
jgi:hypothetical protein